MNRCSSASVRRRPGRRWRQTLIAAALCCTGPFLAATETENHGFRLLPAPGAVNLDGKIDDWDLSGGIFACGELEHLRDQYSLWLHGMYDADNLYLLARWNDPTPLNNPELRGGHGFNGDCLQVRFVMFPDTDQATTSWWDFWRDASGDSVIGRQWPGPVNGVPNNPLPEFRQETTGARQAFAVNADGKGYVQELVIPWKELSVAGKRPEPGSQFRFTIEPNFTAGAFGRISIKDIFSDKTAAPDRIFTFRAYNDWGFATLEKSGKVEPQPVRVADGRTFPTHLENGAPVVDWTGLIRNFEWPGMREIVFDMPFRGYVSLNIYDRNGKIVRHLLNGELREAGRQTVKWDGLDDAVYRTPGQPLPPGEYTWKALFHPGIKLTYRGAAAIGGRAPWQSRPDDFWLGDHGVPTAVRTDGKRIYLACNGAEGGRHLVATDFAGKHLWSLQNTTGAADPNYIAVGNDTVYVLHPKNDWTKGNNSGSISRVNAETGGYLNWQGSKSHILPLESLWTAELPGYDDFTGVAAGGGKLFGSIAPARFFPNDVADWKAMIRLLQADQPPARELYAQIDPRTTGRLKDFLAGKTPQEEAFRTWNGGPRFDVEVTRALNGLLDSTELVEKAEQMTEAELARANFRELVRIFGEALRPFPEDRVVVLDGATGKPERAFAVPQPGPLHYVNDSLLYVISAGRQVLALNPQTGACKPVVTNGFNLRGVTTDAAGRILVSCGAPAMQVVIYTPDGKEVGRIGRPGGHPRIGRWQADGMIDPLGLAVDPQNQLWVAEAYEHPKRVSVWNLENGKLIRDHLGPTHYGASGGAINPVDPNLMVGIGCEWRLDPKTGVAECLGAFDDTYHQFATFRKGPNGRLYLFTNTMRYGAGKLQVWERRGDGDYRKLFTLDNQCGAREGKETQTEFWVDRNGDGERQEQELAVFEAPLFPAGSNSWSLNVGPDLTIYALNTRDHRLYAFPVREYLDNGVPVYEPTHFKKMPEAMSAGAQRNYYCAVPSADNRTILTNLHVPDHPAGDLWTCFDLATGEQLWTYPNPYFQVHGSHRAPAPDPGLFRGAYGPIGCVSTPEAGDFWIINGNLGEWNALTADGFYLTRIFNGNVFEWKWPEEARPGADLTMLPPGSGGEDFGGSATLADDGKIYLQAGKMALWNVELENLDQVRRVNGSGKLVLTESDPALARQFREQALQKLAGTRKVTIKRGTPNFTGHLNADFKGMNILDYQKNRESKVRTALAHDGENLYLGWEVNDPTPFINGARDFSQLYATGDTVDFQFGADPDADPARTEPVAGDLRLSIGNLNGKPTAVLYRFVSEKKNPRVFTSGVVQGYQVDLVEQLDLPIELRKENNRYTVEVKIPFALLGVKPGAGTVFHGDFGATHADPAGERTKLRTHWANQQTGLVDDVVFELQITPKNWGELTFE